MRKFIATGLVLLLALAAAACDRQASCYRDGKGGNTPPIPFAQISSEIAPALSLIHSY